MQTRKTQALKPQFENPPGRRIFVKVSTATNCGKERNHKRTKAFRFDFTLNLSEYVRIARASAAT